MSINELNPYVLVGMGFAFGTLFSILVLDRIYKEIMKKALDEIHSCYKKALEKMKEKYENDCVCGKQT